jgi:hypothetical protein
MNLFYCFIPRIMKNVGTYNFRFGSSGWNAPVVLLFCLLFFGMMSAGNAQTFTGDNAGATVNENVAQAVVLTANTTPSLSSVSAGNRVYIDASLPDAQLLQRAAASTDEGTFHFFSHGRPGELLINGQWYAGAQLANFLRQELRDSKVAQLNIYGCNFAQGETGLAAVNYLEKELGIAIAASTNVTGAGGDWVLETNNFALNKHSKNLLEQYAHTLQTITRRIGASSDDAEQLVSNGSTQFNSSDL